MPHLPLLIYDLTLILACAAVISLLFKKLKQPVVLGYIIAGLLVGPNFKLFPTVAEVDGIKTWAEIGVLFLLFGLGLEFSFKKLIHVGGVAVITALIGVGSTIVFGFLLATFMDWNTMDSLFMGGILAIASTTIIIKTFEELGVKSQKFASIVMGVLVIEDLVAVVLMVVLSTVSVSRAFEGDEMIYSVLKLGFFLILWFIGGIFFIPSLLKAAGKLLSDEILLILSLALCLCMVLLANHVGFSPALGAFIMGSILAETIVAEKIEHLLRPIKNLFGAIFFVSVGMLIDPEMLVLHIKPILAATLVLLIGKPISVATGALLSGQPLKVAIQTGMSLSQIGEFSFIIATLGLTLNVTSDFLYPIAVAVSVLTTFSTPYMIRLSEPVYNLLDRKLPKRWKKSLNRYGASTQKVTEAGVWKKLLRFYFINTVLFSVIIITIILLCTRYFSPADDVSFLNKFITALGSLVVLSPFLWALAFSRPNQELYAKIWLVPAQRGPLLVLLLSRVVLSVFYIGFLFDQLFSSLIALLGVIITSILLFLFRKKIKTFYGKIETRFLLNLNAREVKMKEKSMLAPWDSHITTFELNEQLHFLGKTLSELQLREKFGINVAVIRRGDLVINVPQRSERLFPHDVISVIGSDEQLKKFEEYIEQSLNTVAVDTEMPEVSLSHFFIEQSSLLINKSIRASGIREKTKGLVVGIERNGIRILNPESDLVFQANDTLWMVGNKEQIHLFMAEQTVREL